MGEEKIVPWIKVGRPRADDDIPSEELKQLRKECALEAILEMFGPYFAYKSAEVPTLENLLRQIKERLND